MCRVRVVSFNVCGIKNILENSCRWSLNSFGAMFDSLGADIVCFQETKIQARDIERSMAMVPGWHAFFSSSTSRRGYSGVAVYVKDSIGVIAAEEGLTGWLPASKPTREEIKNIGGYPAIDMKSGREIDSQGRTIVLDLGVAVIIALYCPANSQGNMSEFRNMFWTALDHRVRSLVSAGREVVILGDLNILIEPRDSAPVQHEFATLPKEALKLELNKWDDNNHARKIVSGWLKELEIIDTGRHFNPEKNDMYTCWSQLLNSRPANYGSRVDYILSTHNLPCSGAGIMPDLEGSDHCPIYADFAISLLPSSPLPELGRRLQRLFGSDIRNAFSKVSQARPQSFDISRKHEQPQHKKNPQKKLQRNIMHYWGNSRSSSSPQTSSATDHDPGVQNSLKSIPPETGWTNTNDNIEGDFNPKGSIAQTNDSAKKAWSNIFHQTVPECLHKEPCKLVLSKKPGPNKGRSFWSCARPTGATGDKDFRCKYFRWA